MARGDRLIRAAPDATEFITFSALLISETGPTQQTLTAAEATPSACLHRPAAERARHGRKAASAAGAVSYVLGYLVVYVTQSGRVEEGLSGINVFADLFGGDTISVWRGVGWVFYNAHFVDVDVPSLVGAARSVNFISQRDGGFAYLYVVPPLLLVVAGVAIARAAGARTPADGTQSGALAATGYFPLAVIGAFLFRYAVGDGGSVALTLVTAALLAGLVYPAVFGAVGGAAAGATAE